jgi:hypothetical protein
MHLPLGKSGREMLFLQIPYILNVSIKERGEVYEHEKIPDAAYVKESGKAVEFYRKAFDADLVSSAPIRTAVLSRRTRYLGQILALSETGSDKCIPATPCSSACISVKIRNPFFEKSTMS